MKLLFSLLFLVLMLPVHGQFQPKGSVGLSIAAYEDIRSPIILGTAVYPQIVVPLPIEADIIPGGKFAVSALVKPMLACKNNGFLVNGLLDLGVKYWLEESFAGLYFKVVPFTIFLNQSIDYLGPVNLGFALGCGYDIRLVDWLSAGFELKVRGYYYGFAAFHGSIDGLCAIRLLF